VLYRDIPGEADSEALVIDSLGFLSVVKENETDAQALADAKAWQILSFGPALVDGGSIVVDESSGAKRSNPRTAIGQVSELHYIVIVADGRTKENAGLTYLALAQLFAARDCVVAYNLDGGGSSTMWFNGAVVNEPTDGRTSSERSISDIVYIGYE
jgi:exopolysaccharide biosynthesis protein